MDLQSAKPAFERAGSEPPKARRRRLAPFSLRLSPAERARLEADAGGGPVGAHVKARLFGDGSAPVRRRAATPFDRRALAQALALLGRSRIANNLNQLAHLAHIGALPVDAETTAELAEALAFVRELRRLLLAALGTRSGASSPADAPSAVAQASEEP